MSPADERSGIASLVHGSASDARDLRANLAVFARKTDNPRIRAMVSDVLAGRGDVRDVFRTPEFNECAARGLNRIEAGIDQLTDEQRAEVFDINRPRTQDEKIAAMRDAHDIAPPATARSASDDDDEDFSQRSIYR
jgi:hypothetical protein